MLDDSALARSLAALAHCPAGFVTDVDGTISRITSPPSAATVDPAAHAALRELVGLLDVVAVVSGRDAEDARRMVGLDEVVYLGNHGMERLEGDVLTVSPLATSYRQRVGAAVAALRSALDLPGVTLDDKGVTASVHYRQAQDPLAVERVVVDAARRVADDLGLRVTRGRMVVELRPPIDLNKGTAVRELVVARGLRGVVFVGDDRTDVDAMETVIDLRANSGIAGVCVGVLGPETPSVVRERADEMVQGVDGVARLLQQMATELRRTHGLESG